MTITSITILTGRGTDKVFLHTNYPEACWPYTETLALEFHAAAGSGQAYCDKHWPLIKVELIQRA